MPTIRLTTKEVQVDDIIYVFDVVQIADGFEACVATADAAHCEIEYRPVAKRPAADGAVARDDRQNDGLPLPD
jgi:hypothetical protein